MVAKAAVRITERIPHKDVSYAYLELEAASVNEFQSLRDEALTSPALSHYAFAAKAPAVPTTPAAAPAATVPDPVETGAGDADTTDEDAAAGASEAPTASAPQSEMSPAEKAKAAIAAKAAAPVAAADPSTEGLSPREIAKQRMLAKKEAK